MWQRLLPLVLLVVFALAAVAPIRSYDFFWHLATGRWIAEHAALPLTDPFSVASDRVEWINGEWLFDLLVHGVWSAAGFAGISLVRALLVGALFAFGFAVSRRDGSRWFPLALASLAFAGAHARLDARPLTVAALFVVAGIALLQANSRRSSVAYVALTALWINVHPSAIIAPALAALALLRPQRRIWLPFAGAAALLANPFGWRGVAAPLELIAFARGGTFTNAEWLPSYLPLFPLLYVSIAAGAVVFALAEEKREHFWRMALFVFFAALAVAGIRHQPLFFAAFPLLVAPAAPKKIDSWIWIAAAVLPVAWVAIGTEHRTGPDDRRFPVASVARLRESGLRGNFYNPDQFGGYLIWSFYPERRVLTDGRNELYRRFLGEYDRARGDSRAWRALLQRYRIDLAVDEYRPPLEVVDAATGRRATMPASLAYFPRREWALIAYDHVGMIFARRAAFPPEQIARWEIAGVVPDRR